MTFLKKTLSITALILSFALMVSINFVLAEVLGAWLVAADIAFVMAAAIFVSHVFNLTIPGVRRVLRRVYYRAKFTRNQKKSSSVLGQVYIQFLAYLVLLFKSTEEGFDLVQEEAHELYSDALIFIEKHGGSAKKSLSRDHWNKLFAIHAARQKRAATVMVSGLGVLVIGVLTIGLVSNMIFSPVSETEAATYGWVQTDWSGGSSTSTADHTDDRTGWTKYFAKDPNVDVSTAGEITLSSPMEDWVETTASEFDAGTHQNTATTTVGDGEVILLKPMGANCSSDNQCSSGFCYNNNCRVRCNDSDVGKEMYGGIVAFCFSDDTFAIAQESDHPLSQDDSSWGCKGTWLGCDATTTGAGEAMTQCIIDNCGTDNIAARLCDNSTVNGYTDWFLPSDGELKNLMNNRGDIGGFSHEYYWSSSERHADAAWDLHPSFDQYYRKAKQYDNRVRCIRHY